MIHSILCWWQWTIGIQEWLYSRIVVFSLNMWRPFSLLPAMGTWFCLLGSVLISEFSALSLLLVVKGWWDCGEVGKYICFLKDSVHGWWSKVSYSWTNPSSDWILIKSYHSFSLAQYLNFFDGHTCSFLFELILQDSL